MVGPLIERKRGNSGRLEFGKHGTWRVGRAKMRKYGGGGRGGKERRVKDEKEVGAGIEMTGIRIDGGVGRRMRTLTIATTDEDDVIEVGVLPLDVNRMERELDIDERGQVLVVILVHRDGRLTVKGDMHWMIYEMMTDPKMTVWSFDEQGRMKWDSPLHLPERLNFRTND